MRRLAAIVGSALLGASIASAALGYTVSLPPLREYRTPSRMLRRGASV